MKVKELIKQLQELDQEETICVDYFTREDIQKLAENENCELTIAEIDEILEDVEDAGDTEHGINWQSFRYAMWEIIKRREQ